MYIRTKKRFVEIQIFKVKKSIKLTDILRFPMEIFVYYLSFLITLTFTIKSDWPVIILLYLISKIKQGHAIFGTKALISEIQMKLILAFISILNPKKMKVKTLSYTVIIVEANTKVNFLYQF